MDKHGGLVLVMQGFVHGLGGALPVCKPKPEPIDFL